MPFLNDRDRALIVHLRREWTCADWRMTRRGIHKETRRSRREFPTTLTDESAIAAAAMIGESRMPKNG
jgi:hypothetical protein